MSTAKKHNANKEESNSALLLYLTKLPSHRVFASSQSLRKTFLWANIILFLESSLISISVPDWFHQFFLSGSAVKSGSICWLRFHPWFERQVSGYRHFFLLSSCLLTSPTLKAGSLQKLFLPKSTWILPLILLGLELVSIAPSFLFTNYCIEAKSSVLLSIAQFPGTFFCQTGFLNILNLHFGVFSCTFYTAVSRLLKTTYNCEYMCSLFLIIGDPKDSNPLLLTAGKNAQHYALPDTAVSPPHLLCSHSFSIQGKSIKDNKNERRMD